MQHSVTIWPDELLHMWKSNTLYQGVLKNGRENMSALLNITLGLNDVSVEVNQDFPL